MGDEKKRRKDHHLFLHEVVSQIPQKMDDEQKRSSPIFT